MSEIDDLAALLDECADSVMWPHDVGSVAAELRTSDAVMTDLELACVEILRHPISYLDGEWRPASWGPYGQPMFELESEVLEEVLLVAHQATCNRVRATLFDFLWYQRLGSAHLHAKEAVDAYVGLVKDLGIHSNERLEALHRASDLVLRTNSDVDKVVAAGSELFDCLSASGQHNDLGRAVTATAYLAPLEENATTISRVAALEQRTEDPHDLTELAELRHRIEPELTPSNFDRAIQRYQELAESTDATYSYVFLRKALDLALRWGHPARELLRIDLQRMDPSEVLQPIRNDFKIDQADVDGVVRQIVGGDDLISALGRLCSLMTPLFDLDEQPETGLASMFRTTVFGEHLSTVRQLEPGAVRGLATGPAAQMVFAFFWPAAHRAFQVYGPVAQDVLRWLDGNQFVDDRTASSAVEAAQLFGEQRYEAAVAVILPALERFLRALAVAEGVIVTNDPAGLADGGVKTLGEVFARLGSSEQLVLATDTVERARLILTEDVGGFNLRNRALHGLGSEISGWEATLVLYCALSLFGGVTK